MTLHHRDAVIVDYARSAMGRSKNGCFRHSRADDISATVIQGLLARHPSLDPAEVDDFIWGCVLQREEQAFNIARNIWLRAGLPHTVPAQTVNRLCGSSMAALHTATANIRAGLGDVYLIGGVEHLGHLPMYEAIDPNPMLGLSVAKAAGNMGVTAEYLARLHDITRQQMDEFGARSHQRAAAARERGSFGREIIPVAGHNDKGFPLMVADDETIRADTTVEGLAQLRPVFDPKNGQVTAGTSSQLSDGASSMLVMSAERAQALGLTPIARVVSLGLAGVDPSIMGYGPVPATQKALDGANLTMEDIECVELNEAFAAQSLPVLKDLGLLEDMDDRVNLNGGAIALGHPFGCSGTRITGSLLTVMAEKDMTLGVATMCIGLGQGISTVIERLNG
ncbi:acetyl-CoA C-acyltransferase FadA [Marinimicrobium agarilyticum]|uniref:acetyl-CoA C-acyltransferase FadA n=1 Tax=Marinimicrobium agarilyticum TaxID=306546 RepID=UPI000427D456|nr:acetyl-CoA C-acyltransferase FadA [Marinimicrobium agarilyticum]